MDSIPLCAKCGQRPRVHGGYCRPCKTEYQREYMRQYRHSARYKMHQQAYQARRRDAEGQLSEDDWTFVLAIFNDTCPRCGRPFTPEDPATVDHIIPVSRGGTNDVDNVQPLHRKCNASKGDSTTRYEPPAFEHYCRGGAPTCP